MGMSPLTPLSALPDADRPQCSGKSNAFGVSYVITEGDKSADPPPTIEELVEHGNSTWEVRRFLCRAPARLFDTSCFFRFASIQGMLKYMVSSRLDISRGDGEDRPQKEVLDLLVQSGLMTEA